MTTILFAVMREEKKQIPLWEKNESGALTGSAMTFPQINLD